MLSSYRNEYSREPSGTNSSCLSREGWRLHPASGQGGKAATSINSHITSSDLFLWRKAKSIIKEMGTSRSSGSFRGSGVNRKMTQNVSQFARHWRIHREITNKAQICMKWSVLGSTSQKSPAFFVLCVPTTNTAVHPSQCSVRLNIIFLGNENKCSHSDTSLGLIPSLLISQCTCSGTTLVTSSSQLLPMQHILQWLRSG